MECIIKLIPEDTPAKHTLDYIPVRLSNIYSQYHIFNLRVHRSPRESLLQFPPIGNKLQLLNQQLGYRIKAQVPNISQVPSSSHHLKKKKTGQK